MLRLRFQFLALTNLFKQRGFARLASARDENRLEIISGGFNGFSMLRLIYMACTSFVANL